MKIAIKSHPAFKHSIVDMPAGLYSACIWVSFVDLSTTSSQYKADCKPNMGGLQDATEHSALSLARGKGHSEGNRPRQSAELPGRGLWGWSSWSPRTDFRVAWHTCQCSAIHPIVRPT